MLFIRQTPKCNWLYRDAGALLYSNESYKATVLIGSEKYEMETPRTRTEEKKERKTHKKTNGSGGSGSSGRNANNNTEAKVGKECPLNVRTEIYILLHTHKTRK